MNIHTSWLLRISMSNFLCENRVAACPLFYEYIISSCGPSYRCGGEGEWIEKNAGMTGGKLYTTDQE